MPNHSRAIVARDVTSYPLSGEQVVFSESLQRIYRFNESASFIWDGCRKGMTSGAIAESLAGHYHISVELARFDVEAALSEWKSIGLVGESHIESPSLLKDNKRSALHLDAVYQPITSRDANRFEKAYCLLDTAFRVRYRTLEVRRRVHPVLAHLEVAGGSLGEITLDVLSDRQGYAIMRDGLLVDRCSSLAELAPLLHSNVLMTAYQSAECLMAFHAASVGKGGRCVLLPAPSGSGKSTLTAALIKFGFEYLTDEVVLLMPSRGSCRIRALPSSLSLKQPVWSVLSPYYPDLGKLPVHWRRDGRQVRYLGPPRGGRSHPQRQYEADAIVFPKYGASTPTELISVSPAEALHRITGAGYDVSNGPLDAEGVGQVVSWIEKLACYELRYHSLSEAVARVGSLLR